jgi:beta-lactamase regulating signal transducer with metallopeptidase domain
MNLNEMISGWWLHSAMGGGLLLLLAGLLMLWTRQPARRQRLGEWGAAAALLLALLSPAPAWLLVPVLPSEQPKPPDPVASVEEYPAPPDLPALYEPAQSWDDAVALDEAPPSEIPAQMPEPAPPAASSFSLTTLCHWLPGAYLVAAAFFGVRFLWHYLRLWRLLHFAQPAPAPIAELFTAMSSGLTPKPRMLVSDRLHVPVSCGLLRPTVLLPASFAHHAEEKVLRWVFAHELTHLRRRDAWTCMLFGLAQAVYFYVPWFWPLRRQVRLCQEYLADAAAVEQGVLPEDYAEFLLRLVPLPAPPAATTSVLGHSSDLFRRVTMLLKMSSLEKQCPRFWSLAVAVGLLCSAVVLSGLGLKASEAPAPKDEPKKEEPKKETPKKEVQPLFPGVPNIQELLPADLPPEVADMLKTQMEQLQKQMAQMQEQMKGLQGLGGAMPFNPGFPGGGFSAGGFAFGPGFPGGNALRGRLGAAVRTPDATLIEQLDLPKNQGLVLAEVRNDSAAAKAGLKANDILLELNGKPVSSEPREFVKTLDEIKPNTPVNAVVLRKGKKETIKGLSLPEAPKAANLFQGGGFGGGGGRAFGGGFGGGLPGGNGMSMSRNGDNFKTTYQEGQRTIAVSGKIDQSKATVEEIRITNNGETKTYKTIDDVPADLRDQVKKVIRQSEESGVRPQDKKPFID